MHYRNRAWAVLGLGLWLACQRVLAGPIPDLLQNAGMQGSMANLPIDIKADKMEFDQDKGIVVGTGHVTIRRTNEVLTADTVELNLQENTVHARGDVVFARDGAVWRGHEFTYNFVTKEWRSGPFAAFVDPFRIQTMGAERVSEVSYVLHDVVLSTCTNDPADYHYRVRAAEAEIEPGKTLKAHRVVFYLGDVPIFYSPYWYRSLSDRTVGYDLRAGYRSSWGAYLLNSVRFPLAPDWKTVSHVDWRFSRGFGFGQDLLWSNVGEEGKGGIAGYFVNDTGVWKEHEDPAEQAQLEEQRYRLKFWHYQPFTPKDYLLTEFNYLADPYVVQDFFEKEYRLSAEPENYVSAVHREDTYTLGAMVRTRLNDFFTTVTRAPEFTLDIPREQIGDSPFYYESASALSYLQKLYSVETNLDDYSALRLDSRHYVYYPTRHYGFLNVVPRAGIRGTYYSKTFDSEDGMTVQTSVVTSEVAGANGALVTNISSQSSTVAVTRLVEAGAQMRSLVELGTEVSFKSFRTWETDQPTPLFNGFRHVVEPYVNYTLVPEPSVTSNHLYQFDEVDALGKSDFVRFGVRNKLQTRQKDRPRNLVDMDIYSYYYFETDDGQDARGDLYTRTDLTPVNWFHVEYDAQYNPNTSTLVAFNTRFWYIQELWRFGTEFRYLDQSSSLISPTLNLMPNKYWTFEAFARYDAEGSRLEEHGYYAQKNYDCLSVRAGASHLPAYTEVDGTAEKDEFRAEFSLWIRAFPTSTLGASDRHIVGETND